MRVHWLQHVEFEGLGAIAPWLRQQRIDAIGHPVFARALPAADDVEALIVMGGPMSAYDDHLPWIAAEKALIRRCIEAGRPVLGICLGAQLIAAALGAGVTRHHEREIGWFEVTAEPVARRVAPWLPPSAVVYQWHSDTFELPPGSIPLAASAACPRQGFALGERVIALQFHLEMERSDIADLITHSGPDRQPGRFVQADADMLDGAARHGPRARAILETLLAHWLGS